jgi:O-antigen ligase
MTFENAISRYAPTPPWGGVVGLWLSFMIVVGGTTTPSPQAVLLHTVAGVILAAVAIFRLRQGFPNQLALSGTILLIAAFGLIILQLIPLPPEIWTALPGRDLISRTLARIGAELPWLPLSMEPPATKAAFLALVPALAGFLACLSLKQKDVSALALTIVVCSIIGVLIGIMQKSGNWPASLYFYGDPELRVATGTFGNRNFLAAQIFASIPFVAAAALAIQQRLNTRPILTMIFALIYAAIMLAGLAVVGSRGGIALAMLSVFLTILFVYRKANSASTWKSSGFAVVAMLATLLLISQASMVGLLRLAQSDPLEDFRTVIFDVVLNATKAFWPYGSGFGSFVEAYQMYETPAQMVDNFVNAAHNDWLQLLLEGGAAALFLMIIFILLFLTALKRIIQHNMGPTAHTTCLRAAAASVVLLSLHAIVDFGLRTPALLSLFSVCCGLLCLSAQSLSTFCVATLIAEGKPK